MILKKENAEQLASKEEIEEVVSKIFKDYDHLDIKKASETIFKRSLAFEQKSKVYIVSVNYGLNEVLSAIKEVIGNLEDNTNFYRKLLVDKMEHLNTHLLKARYIQKNYDYNFILNTIKDFYENIDTELYSKIKAQVKITKIITIIFNYYNNTLLSDKLTDALVNSVLSPISDLTNINYYLLVSNSYIDKITCSYSENFTSCFRVARSNNYNYYGSYPISANYMAYNSNTFVIKAYKGSTDLDSIKANDRALNTSDFIGRITGIFKKDNDNIVVGLGSIYGGARPILSNDLILKDILTDYFNLDNLNLVTDIIKDDFRVNYNSMYYGYSEEYNYTILSNVDKIEYKYNFIFDFDNDGVYFDGSLFSDNFPPEYDDYGTDYDLDCFGLAKGEYSKYMDCFIYDSDNRFYSSNLDSVIDTSRTEEFDLIYIEYYDDYYNVDDCFMCEGNGEYYLLSDGYYYINYCYYSQDYIDDCHCRG